MSVLTEGNVSANILSFTKDDYLYTATVCSSWGQNCSNKRTSILHALASVPVLEEAIDSGLETYQLLDLAIVFGADMRVVRKIGETTVCSTNIISNFAAFKGDVGTLVYLNEDPDEYTLYEAIRGGKIAAVRHIVTSGCPLDTVAEWPSSFYEDDAFFERCDRIAEYHGREDVLSLIKMYVIDVFYFADVGNVELAVLKNREDILQLLHEAGAALPMDIFRLAVDTCNLKMLGYILKVKGPPASDFVVNYMLSERFDILKLELLLTNGFVHLRACDLQHAIHSHKKPLTDLLIKFDCPIDDHTVDHAVAAWDFGMASRLVESHGRCPTEKAYEWLFTGGLCESCVTGLYPKETDGFYIDKLNWLYSVTGGKTGFFSFSDMEATPSWSKILQRLSTGVKSWFRHRLL